MTQQFHSWVSEENKNINLRRYWVDQNVRLDFPVRCYRNLNELFGQSNIRMEFPGGPGVRTPMLPLQGAQVWSLAEEQRSQNPWSVSKKKSRSPCTLMFTAALLATAKIWMQAKCPSAGEQIKKMWDTHTHTFILKNLPAMRQTWVQSLGWDDSLEKGMATHSGIPAWRTPMDRGT